ncbi:MAG: hypothetical protein IH612_05900 [Desulfofustis sp.]|nr:hypothetical protein [Desulfofustis sp.]
MKTNQLKLSMVLMVGMAAMLACSVPLLSTPVIDPGATNTAVAETVDARLTEVWTEATATQAALPPTATLAPTNTPMPTSTPAPTNTPLPTATATSEPVACNAAYFVQDMTVIDGSALPKNSPFVKIWRLKNIGTCTWTKDYEVTFDGGDKMGGTTVSMPKSVAPGGLVDIAIEMTAPDTAGKYKGYWILRDEDGTKFGLGGNYDVPFYVQLKVVDSAGSYKYNFANKVCKATWKTDTHTLNCLGSSQAYSNYVLFSTSFKLETGRIENEPAIIANVETGQRLWGSFPDYIVKTGDHFVTEIGCVGDNTQCKVKMALRYRIKGTTTTGILGEWVEKHDEKTTMVDIDLSSLVGQEVIFILDMEAKSSSDTNEVFWFVPSIRNP